MARLAPGAFFTCGILWSCPARRDMPGQKADRLVQGRGGGWKQHLLSLKNDIYMKAAACARPKAKATAKPG